MTPQLVPSEYQHRIFDFVETGSGNGIIEAVAGSGKTTTLLEICKLIPRSLTVRFFAFNRSIADTLKSRLVGRSNVMISTYHSAGYQALLRHLPAKVETDRHKMRELMRNVLSDIDYRAYSEGLGRLLGLAKGVGIGLPFNTDDNWLGLIAHHDLEFDWMLPPQSLRPANVTEEQLLEAERNRVVGLAIDLLEQSNAAAGQEFEWSIDFDDQLYIPLLWDLPFPQYDVVLVDEGQDTNDVQREILKRSLKPGGRLLVVGDRHQAIYGWRGASHDALDLIQEAFDCVRLPLSICYRCPKSVIVEAQALVPQIEAAPGAREGEVKKLVPLEALATLTPQDAILCRNNAPLVKTAYSLIAQGIGCQILGRDIGYGLIKLIERLGAEDVDDLDTKLLEFRHKETTRYRKLNQESKAQGVEDRVQCIQTIIEALTGTQRTIPNIVASINRLFSDTKGDLLTLATVHKAKGQEWPRVAIIRSDLMPSKWADQDWQLQQEHNLQYVAWTRAAHSLWFMDDMPDWKRKKLAREAGLTDGVD